MPAKKKTGKKKSAKPKKASKPKKKPELAIGSYNPLELEPQVLEFWEKNKIHEKAGRKGR